MFWSLTLLALLDPSAGTSSDAALHKANQFTSYTLAYREAQRVQKPLLVILNPGPDAEPTPIQLAEVGKTQHRRELLEQRFVVAVVDTSTKHGEVVQKLFGAKPAPEVVVIDREQKFQVFRTARKLQGEDWNRILETFQNGETTARLSLDAPANCPFCQNYNVTAQ